MIAAWAVVAFVTGASHGYLTTRSGSVDREFAANSAKPLFVRVCAVVAVLQRHTLHEPSSLVFVVDDDASVRSEIATLLRSVGLAVATFASALEFLSAPLGDQAACLVLDVSLPGTDGLELQRDLAERYPALQIVFITGHGDIAMAVRAIKAGAVEFLSKPFRDQALLDAIDQGLYRSRHVRQQRIEIRHLEQRLALLTPRQRQVMQLVVSGMLNKEIAYDLGISVMTVKVHRGQVMQKFCANSVADLVRMADRLGISPSAA